MGTLTGVGPGRGGVCTGTLNPIWKGREKGESTGPDMVQCGRAWLFVTFSVILFSIDFSP